MTPRAIAQTSFLLLVNGDASGQPASGVRDVLLQRGAELVTHYHPLGPEDGRRHELTRYSGGRARRRVVRLPSRTPYTYPVDLLVPPRLPAADVAIAFNCLHVGHCLAARRLGRKGQIVYSAVDFVADRFGAGSPLTRAYDAMDEWACRAADARWEVSEQALLARTARHGLGPGAARAEVVPVGTWVDQAAKVPPTGIEGRRVVFSAHLVPRMGGDTVVEAIGQLARRGVDVHCDITGRGPEAAALEERAAALGLGDRIHFHGFITEPARFEAVLAGAAIGLAPYRTGIDSFTAFADPSKVKSYLSAGLPILLTDVPPNASELEQDGGAEIVRDDPSALADSIARLLDDPREWARRRQQALEYATHFDYSTVVARALAPLGLA